MSNLSQFLGPSNLNLSSQISNLSSQLDDFDQTWNVIGMSSNFTAGTTSFTAYNVNSNSGEITVQIPVSPNNGSIIAIRRIGTNNVILQPADVINGSSETVNLNRNFSVISLVAINSGWYIS